MNGGDVILADEPTGALDSHSGIEVMRILRELNAAGHTIILVTHDIQVAKMQRVLSKLVTEKLLVTVLMFQTNLQKKLNLIPMLPLLYKISKKVKAFQLGVQL